MDLNFYNKCKNVNRKINKVNDYIKNQNHDFIICIGIIKDIRIINKYIDSSNNILREINTYPGFSFELTLSNNLLIEIVCPPENNNKQDFYIEINIIDEYLKKRFKDKNLYKFPVIIFKLNDISKNIYDMSMIKY